MIDFDPIRHQYSDGGVTLPSVTQILRAAGLIDGRWHAPARALLGTQVHQASAQFDRKEKTIGEFERPVARYLASWAFWKFTSEAEMVEIEKIVGGIHLGYAGTVDRVAKMDGERVVLDLKTGSPCPWHQLQLAGYAMAVGLPIRRLGIYLSNDFGVRVREFRAESDFAEFQKALQLVKEGPAMPFSLTAPTH